MTPKQKADDIMQKCMLTHVLAILNTKGKLISPYVSNYAYSIVRKERAKNLALIAVDEILEECRLAKDSYWEEVKQEIEKL
jgi:hypothetical protein